MTVAQQFIAGSGVAVKPQVPEGTAEASCSLPNAAIVTVEALLARMTIWNEGLRECQV